MTHSSPRIAARPSAPVSCRVEAITSTVCYTTPLPTSHAAASLPHFHPSSSAKCSAASVGPNRSCSVLEYFSRIRCSTFRRNFSGASRGSNFFPRCGAAALWRLARDIAATVSTPADNSTPTSSLRLPTSASASSLAPEPRPVEVPLCSSPSSSTSPGARSVGDISNGAEGDTIKEAQDYAHA
jgi:hypothetical protein